jgi:hypothetical protein
VLISSGAPGDNAAAVPIQQLSGAEKFALDVLVMGGPLSSGDWHEKISDLTDGGVSDRTFQRRRSRLIDKGLVEEVGPGSHIYKATEEGCATANGSANGVPVDGNDDPSRASHATTPKGVAGDRGQATADSRLSDNQDSTVHASPEDSPTDAEDGHGE